MLLQVDTAQRHGPAGRGVSDAGRGACPPDDPAILFKSGTLANGLLYLTTQTEVLVYRVPSFELTTGISLPSFNDVHHVRPTADGTLLVAVTGLDMVAESDLRRRGRPGVERVAARRARSGATGSRATRTTGWCPRRSHISPTRTTSSRSATSRGRRGSSRRTPSRWSIRPDASTSAWSGSMTASSTATGCCSRRSTPRWSSPTPAR